MTRKAKPWIRKAKPRQDGLIYRHVNPNAATAVYSLYDSAGAILYIGMSCRPEDRIRDHRYCWPSMGNQIATWSLNWHQTRALAAEAERIAIEKSQPPYNDEHTHGYKERQNQKRREVVAQRHARALAMTNAT